MWRNENCMKYGGKMGRRSCNREMETVGGGEGQNAFPGKR